MILDKIVHILNRLSWLFFESKMLPIGTKVRVVRSLPGYSFWPKGSESTIVSQVVEWDGRERLEYYRLEGYLYELLPSSHVEAIERPQLWQSGVPSIIMDPLNRSI